MPDPSMLAETAVAAAGGGAVVSLVPAGADGRRWRAVVAGPHRRRLVDLDIELATAVLRSARRPRARWRGSPGCTMRACPPRSRRQA